MAENTTVEEFPHDEFRALLQAAQNLFATPQDQRNLLASIGISQALNERQRYTASVPDAPVFPSQRASTVEVRHGIKIGDSGKDDVGEVSSPARFANELLELVATPDALDRALTLARRSTKVISDTENPRWVQLIEQLQSLQKKYRSQQEVPDLEGYQAWQGFECKHPYSLTERFFGRESQLTQLHAWASNKDDKSVHCLCALGGGGKSALAWYWLSQSMTALRQGGYYGAFWCSFYEKNFNFDEFLRRALMFAAGMEEKDLPRARGEVEQRLLEVFKTKRFLFVLDGLERLMNGYAMVADRAMDLEGQGEVLKHADVPRVDRRMVDPRDSAFLRQLATEQATRILITTRLVPADLQEMENELPLDHVIFTDLPGFSRTEAEMLWHYIAPSAPVTDAVHEVFYACSYHPLVISILARSVVYAGGTWESWLSRDVQRNLDLQIATSEAALRAHIIGICMRDLPEEAYVLLGVLTATGKPMHLDELTRVLLLGSQVSGDGHWDSEATVKVQIEELVRLGYVGAASPPNQPTEYDVHPVVRGAVWNFMLDPKRERFLEYALSEVAATPNRRGPEELSDLNNLFALYRLFAKSRQLDRAWEMFSKLQPALERDGAYRELFDLYRQLLPDRDVIQLLPLSSRRAQGDATDILGSLLSTAGEGEHANRVLRWCGAIRLQIGDHDGFLRAAHSRAWQSMYEGRLFETERNLHGIRLEALAYGALEWVPIVDCWIGIILALRGEKELARDRFDNARGKTFSNRWWIQGLAEGLVYLESTDQALKELQLLPDGVGVETSEGPLQAAWEKLTQGIAYFQAKDDGNALELLSAARTDARKANYTVIRCYAIPYIAELMFRNDRIAEACEILESYNEIDPRARYAMCAADAKRVWAKCQLKMGNLAVAAEAAREAYQLAACDGPPFVYKAGLRRAFEMLEECGTYVPTTIARLDPLWREKLEQLEQKERQEERRIDEIRAMLTSSYVRKELSLEQALAAFEEPPVMKEASKADKDWWEDVAGKRAAVKIPLANELQQSGISLQAFREGFNRSSHKSFNVVFHQLHAEHLLAPDKPRPVRYLKQQDIETWLLDFKAHNQALDTFLDTEMALMVRRPFEVHRFDDKDIVVFLKDSKRRIKVNEDPMAARFWDQLEEKRSPLDMLVLAECVARMPAELHEFVDHFSVGNQFGLAYAFASLLTKRAIENHESNELSKTEGWSEVEILLRLQDVKLRLGWVDTSAEAKKFWERLELENDHRRGRVLALTEELARRHASIESYFQAYVASSTENIQANLSYVDYLGHYNKPWDDANPWPATEATERWAYETLRPKYMDTDGLSNTQIEGQAQIFLEHLGWDRVNDSDKTWWKTLTKDMLPSARLRLLEELDVRFATLGQLRRAFVDGDTSNHIAALAYLDFTILKSSETQQAKDRADEHNRVANSLYEKGNYREAIKKYEAAIGVHEEPVYFSNLAGAWERVDDIDRLESLGQASAVLRRGIQKLSDNKNLQDALYIIETRLRLIEKGALPKHAKSTDMLPVVTPIAIEVAANLIPTVETSEYLEVVVPKMRERISADMGVQVPGIRVRGNETDLPHGTYIIMLDEVPLVSGNAALDKALTHTTEEELNHLAIEHEETTDPLSGEKAYLISLDHAAQLSGPYWDPGEYMARHLESVLRKNLSMFTGIQEAVGFLEKVWSPVAQKISSNRMQVARFARMLQALVSESVPVTEMEAICEAFAKKNANEGSMDDLLCDVRSLPEVVQVLPGNCSGAQLFDLSSEIEMELSRSMIPLGDEHVLAIPPEFTQDVLTAIRNELSTKASVSRSEVLVVRNDRIRRYVRKLVELEFPNLYTLSESELLEHVRELPRTSIALD
ncbi:MAG: FHIPEP family type III secretion protein [Candidatus Thiodiazotropha sp. DIVDIV]